MNLRQPLWLLLLLPILGLGLLSILRRSSLRFSPAARIAKAGLTWRVRLWWLPELLTVVLFSLLALLLAAPEKNLDPDSREGEGLSIAIALDRSGSMAAQIPYEGKMITRLDGVKRVTGDFLSKRKDDQAALISFARYPETHTPLTGNREILSNLLSLLSLPTTKDEDGTSIGDALALATARLSRSGDKKGRVIILLTDGQNNAGEKSPAEGAELAKAQGIPVYTIGLGGAGVIMVDTPMGQQAVNARVDLDEKTLQSVAQTTGGTFYKASSLAELSSLYSEIAARETDRLELKSDRIAELDINPGLWILLLLILARPLVSMGLLRRGDL